MQRSEEQTPSATVTGIILAGGRSSRMGGDDKGLLPLRGRPMVASVAAMLRPLATQLLICANRNGDRYAPYADRVIPDRIAGHPGPLAGLDAAASVCLGDEVIVLPCDMPFLSPALLPRLLHALRASPPGCKGIWLRAQGRDHYLCCAVRQPALASAGELLKKGRPRVRDWLQEIGARPATLNANAQSLVNLNEPGELAAAEAAGGSSRGDRT